MTRINDLAKRIGITSEGIKYYVRMGHLPAPPVFNGRTQWMWDESNTQKIVDFFKGRIVTK